MGVLRTLDTTWPRRRLATKMRMAGKDALMLRLEKLAIPSCWNTSVVVPTRIPLLLELPARHEASRHSHRPGGTGTSARAAARS
jgi:hypothetical protein